jgi:hypothetical protein
MKNKTKKRERERERERKIENNIVQNKRKREIVRQSKRKQMKHYP